jgi:hypothetical protein
MPVLVVNGATLKCVLGLAPSTLIVTPEKKVFADNMPAANIMDFVPMKNIMPFGNCTSPSFPATAAATTAALGVLTPMPCIPLTTPWKPGAATVMIGNMPALNNTSTCQCSWGGLITVVSAGQATVMVP